MWNMAIGWFILVPLVGANEAIGFVMEGVPAPRPAALLIDLAMFCFIMSPTAAVGTAAHSLALLVYWVLARGRWLPLGTIALAPLVPLTVHALQLSGFRFLDLTDAGVKIAVAVYALAASVQWRFRSMTRASPDP